MITRDNTHKEIPLNIVGSSVFGRYPKISIEKTYNMFISDGFMVPYAGYSLAIRANKFGDALEGRGGFVSTKLNKMILVMDDKVYLTDLSFNQQFNTIMSTPPLLIGQLHTLTGIVYITENNKPQILISDNTSLYIYDPSLGTPFQVVPTPNFIPGYITFHDTYFICAARQDDFYAPPANNTWRLSDSNNGLLWPDDASHIGLLQTKPDNTQAVLRAPSKGNMIFVMGSIVTEPWFDTGAQLFPYQRNNQMNIDYGCISPATVAYMDELTVWLAKNEKSGTIILYSDGSMPRKVTTDGIDYFFANLTAPEDSQAFLYRQDGHLFYHINFYTDNVSFFVDFLPDGSHKIYHACDQNMNYFIASQVMFFKNQYYFISRNSGNLYAFDTTFTTYEDVDQDGNVVIHEIPRFRSCKNIRSPNQEPFVINDLGFTIETGETPYQINDLGILNLITEDGKFLVTEGPAVFLTTELDEPITTEAGDLLIDEHGDPLAFNFLIDEHNLVDNRVTPRVDLSISYDGGASFGNDMPYVLPGVGKRRNKLMWWQLGWTNDAVPLLKFWGIGRFVITDGTVHIRQ